MPQHKDAKHRRICLSKKAWLQTGGAKRPPGGRVRECLSRWKKSARKKALAAIPERGPGGSNEYS
ncbi:MAG: hypothetical protein NTU95_02105 [Methanothrix sp.]|nr:hypothetical protein [Methanothrix sp.]